MIRHRYRREVGSLGRVLRPVADVVLENRQVKVEVPMYVDSGADLSVIPFRFGKALGFKQGGKNEIRELKGISGAGVPYVLKTVTLVMNGVRLKVRMAWALVEEVPMLMGRMDVFNKFRVVFDEKRGCIDFE
ncbi:MAG: hypothetical protein HY896_06225 [Deltaproteobacteria bacterium]|nr:hypothetical protein [Deltaproteobacteria bacterium]